MIGFLKGRLLSSAPDQVLLDVGGVGYLVHVPYSTFCEIEKLSSEEPVELHIRTHVREDALDLYGFHTPTEKLVFEKLINVSGIGPKLAQTVMSGMAWEDILAALAGANVARLTRIPGVGKKTAERMVLELKDTAAEIRAELEHEPLPAGDPGLDELVSALVNLGYRKNEAEAAASAALEEAPGGRVLGAAAPRAEAAVAGVKGAGIRMTDKRSQESGLARSRHY